MLPAAVRRQLRIAAGDRLLVSVEEDGSVRLVSVREQAERMRGMLKDRAPGRSVVDELIAERRAEARKEESE